MGVRIRPMTLVYTSPQSPRHGTSIMNRKLEALQLSLSLFFTYLVYPFSLFRSSCMLLRHSLALPGLSPTASVPSYSLSLSLSFSLFYYFTFVKSTLAQTCMSYLCIRFSSMTSNIVEQQSLLLQGLFLINNTSQDVAAYRDDCLSCADTSPRNLTLCRRPE